MVTALISDIPPAIRAKPTLRDVMEEIIRTHACIHDVGQKQDALAAKVETVQIAVAHMQGVQETITTRIGVPNASPAQIVEEAGKPVKKALILGSMTKPQLAFAILGAMSGIAIVYRILTAVVGAAWPAFHHAMLVAK